MGEDGQTVRSGANPDKCEQNYHDEGEGCDIDPQEPASRSGIGEWAITKVGVSDEKFSSGIFEKRVIDTGGQQGQYTSQDPYFRIFFHVSPEGETNRSQRGSTQPIPMRSDHGDWNEAQGHGPCKRIGNPSRNLVPYEGGETEKRIGKTKYQKRF